MSLFPSMDRTGSREEAIAKIINIVMLTAILMAIAIFAIFSAIHHALLLANAETAHRNQHVEMLIGSLGMLVSAATAAAGFLRKDKSRQDA